MLQLLICMVSCILFLSWLSKDPMKLLWPIVTIFCLTVFNIQVPKNPDVASNDRSSSYQRSQIFVLHLISELGLKSRQHDYKSDSSLYLTAPIQFKEKFINTPAVLNRFNSVLQCKQRPLKIFKLHCSYLC